MHSVAPVRAGPGFGVFTFCYALRCTLGATERADRGDDMDKTAAVALASRLKNTHGLAGHTLIERVEPQCLNQYAGGDAGWGVTVTRADGEVLSIIGSSAGGYMLTTKTSGAKPLDRLVTEDLTAPKPEQPDETSPAGDADLVDRLTAVAATLRGIDSEVAAIRDELRLRSNRVPR